MCYSSYGRRKARVPYRFYNIQSNHIINKLKKMFLKKYSYYKKYSNKLNYNNWISIMKEKDFDKIIISKGLYANISVKN